MAMSPAGHGDEAKPSSVIPERPTAPDGGVGQLDALAAEVKRIAKRNTATNLYHLGAENWNGGVRTMTVEILQAIADAKATALAASAPSCPVGEKELETGQHLVADRLGAISATEKGAK